MTKYYENVIVTLSNQIVNKIWEKYELEPGFQIEVLIERLGGSIQEGFNSKFLFGDIAYISPTEDGQNFKIICSSDYMDGNKIKETFRLRYELAKELAHLFLHMIKEDGESVIITSDFREDIKDVCFYDFEARTCALILLMPEIRFRAYCERFNLILDNRREKIKKLSELFKVNEKFVLERCELLDIMIW